MLLVRTNTHALALGVRIACGGFDSWATVESRSPARSPRALGLSDRHPDRVRCDVLEHLRRAVRFRRHSEHCSQSAYPVTDADFIGGGHWAEGRHYDCRAADPGVDVRTQLFGQQIGDLELSGGKSADSCRGRAAALWHCAANTADVGLCGTIRTPCRRTGVQRGVDMGGASATAGVSDLCR